MIDELPRHRGLRPLSEIKVGELRIASYVDGRGETVQTNGRWTEPKWAPPGAMAAKNHRAGATIGVKIGRIIEVMAPS
jgi:hypothetical protein